VVTAPILDPKDLAPHFHGGRPALDLVNTVGERWRRSFERLLLPRDLARWLVAAGVVGRELDVDEDLLQETRDLREAICRLCDAAIARAPAPAADVALLDRWLVVAGARPQLALGPDGVPVLGEMTELDSARRAVGLVALDAARLLGTGERERIRVCAAEDCAARFFDRSGRRRWCSMERCGNVAKVRRHRARAGGGGGGS
jgi:predicted RNA-binding Zn ribbon-like protein